MRAYTGNVYVECAQVTYYYYAGLIAMLDDRLAVVRAALVCAITETGAGTACLCVRYGKTRCDRVLVLRMSDFAGNGTALVCLISRVCVGRPGECESDESAEAMPRARVQEIGRAHV